MCVHFVYRCHYVGPSGKHVAHFPDDSVLAWFQHHWSHLKQADKAADRLEELLGCDVYGLASLFEAAVEHDLPPPASPKQLAEYVDRYLYVEGLVSCKAHLIQALTDDDDLMMAYFFFDDHLLARYGDRAAFLLTEGWQLPGGSATPGFRPKTKTRRVPLGGKGEGTTFAVLLSVFSSDHLEFMDESYRLEQMRLPDMVRHLVLSLPDDHTWPFELCVLRTQLLASPEKCSPIEEAFLDDLRKQEDDETPWRVYSDWLLDHDELRVGQTLLLRALQRVTRFAPRAINYEVDRAVLLEPSVKTARATIDSLAATFQRQHHVPGKSRVHVEDHLAQLCLHAFQGFSRDEWHQWYFFDDLWAAAHPAIAEALLRYGKRWDALSAPSSDPMEPG
jgi:uncharacterized protein (TIGR02996 family)